MSLEESNEQRSHGRDEFDEAFAKKMGAAGLTSSSRIGIAVSGGPDSTALCILASRWMLHEGGSASNLVSFIVDHKLRAESSSEALLVRDRIVALGIRCEVLECTWLNGLPSQGHMQEAARIARYNLLRKACRNSCVNVLLTAHHSDDQIELFIIRFTRHSGLAGLACMPFVSKLWGLEPELDHTEDGCIHAIWLVRPLLELSKDNLYEVCRKRTQPWVEDPTNKKLVFLRNVVRSLLNEADYSMLKKEVPQLIRLSQKVRAFLDTGRAALLLEAVSIDQNFGNVLINLNKLKPTECRKQLLYRTLTAVLQFVAQKEKPPRGKVVQDLADALITSRLKGALTLAGCYVCMDPGSKGTRLLICASCESKAPLNAPVNMVWACDHHRDNNKLDPPPLHSRMEISKSVFSLNETTKSTDLSARLAGTETLPQFLSAAKKAHMLSESSFKALCKLQDTLSLQSKNTEARTSHKKTHSLLDVGGSSLRIPCDHACYFMNRFVITWGERKSEKCQKCPSNLPSVQVCRISSAELSSAEVGKELVVRYMQEKDWILLYQCGKQKTTLSGCKEPSPIANVKSGGWQDVHVLPCCMELFSKRALEAMVKLKRVPLPVRRGLPVLATTEGALLSIPSLGLSLCPNIWVSSRFCPRLPLGGGPVAWW